MILLQNNMESQIVNGTWVETNPASSPTISAPYTFQSGLYVDYTTEITSREWAFIPAGQALEDSDIVEKTILENATTKIVRIGNGRGFREHVLNTAVTGGSVTHKFMGFNSGTVAKTIADFITTAADTSPLDKTLWNAEGTQWNRNCYGFGFDLTAVVARSYQRAQLGWIKEPNGVLITPRHVRLVHHYPMFVGQRIRFVSKGATSNLDIVYEREIIGTSYNHLGGVDPLILTLSSDLPETIAPMRIASAGGFYDSGYARSPGFAAGRLSDLFIKTGSSQHAFGLASEDSAIHSAVQPGGNNITSYPPASVALCEAYVTEWLPFWADYVKLIRPVLQGDSGSPTMIPISQTQVALIAEPAGEMAAAIAYADANCSPPISTGYTPTYVSDFLP